MTASRQYNHGTGEPLHSIKRLVLTVVMGESLLDCGLYGVVEFAQAPPTISVNLGYLNSI